MDTSGPAGRRRLAPAATAVGYFPPLGVGARPIFPEPPLTGEKQEEDDEDNDEEDDDENDEDEADEVSVEERAPWTPRLAAVASNDQRARHEVAPPSSLRLLGSDERRVQTSRRASRAPRRSRRRPRRARHRFPNRRRRRAFTHVRATERARGFPHRLQLQFESKRCRAVEAYATELTRRFGRASLALNPPVGSLGGRTGRGDLLGAEGPISGSASANELWSEPKRDSRPRRTRRVRGEGVARLFGGVGASSSGGDPAGLRTCDARALAAGWRGGAAARSPSRRRERGGSKRVPGWSTRS